MIDFNIGGCYRASSAGVCRFGSPFQLYQRILRLPLLIYAVSAMAFQTTTSSRATSSNHAYLLKQYSGMHDLHRGRTAEQISSLPTAVRPNCKGTWAYDTVHRRLREDILKRVFEENAHFLKADPGCLQKLQELDREMQASLSTPLRKLLPSRTASLSCAASDVAAGRPRPTAAAEAKEDGATEKSAIDAACKANGGCAEMSFALEEKQRYYPVEVELADVRFWNEVVLQREDVPARATWATVPWLVAELYFYRRLAEAFSHFENGYDFFGKQKRASLAESTGLLLEYADALKRLRSNISAKKQVEARRAMTEKVETADGTRKTAASEGGHSTETKKGTTTHGNQDVEQEFLMTRTRDLRNALLASLNGNAADLSLWPVESENDVSEPDGIRTRSSSKPDVDPENSSRILCDDTTRFLADFLVTERAQQHKEEKQRRELQKQETEVVNGDQEVKTNGTKKDVHSRKNVAYIFLDNAGTELLSDLWLACNLIEHAVVQKVVFLTKQFPIFVSDALPVDIDYTIQWIQQQATSKHPPAVKELADLWTFYVKEGKWIVKPHVYFSLPFEYSDMPKDLYDELKEEAAFIISKGDANYRRILGDRAWPLQTPFSQVASYFPAPLMALRKLKADIGCGIPLQRQQEAENQDSSWMTNGKWGVLHYSRPKNAEELDK